MIDLTADDHKIIGALARRVAERYPHIDWEDIQQHALLRTLAANLDDPRADPEFNWGGFLRRVVYYAAVDLHIAELRQSPQYSYTVDEVKRLLGRAAADSAGRTNPGDDISAGLYDLADGLRLISPTDRRVIALGAQQAKLNAVQRVKWRKAVRRLTIAMSATGPGMAELRQRAAGTVGNPDYRWYGEDN
jgi:hypothetical protein